MSRCWPDSNGRILLSKRYRQMADIRSDVRFIGMDDTIEIWAEEKVARPFMEAEEFSGALQEVLGGASRTPDGEWRTISVEL